MKTAIVDTPIEPAQSDFDRLRECLELALVSSRAPSQHGFGPYLPPLGLMDKEPRLQSALADVMRTLREAESRFRRDVSECARRALEEKDDGNLALAARHLPLQPYYPFDDQTNGYLDATFVELVRDLRAVREATGAVIVSQRVSRAVLADRANRAVVVNGHEVLFLAQGGIAVDRRSFINEPLVRQGPSFESYVLFEREGPSLSLLDVSGRRWARIHTATSWVRDFSYLQGAKITEHGVEFDAPTLALDPPHVEVAESHLAFDQVQFHEMDALWRP